MKKYLKHLILTLLLVSSLILAACNGSVSNDTDDSSQDLTDTVETESQKTVVIASDGKPIYNVVRYIDAIKDEYTLIAGFRNSLNEKCNMSFAIASDWNAPILAPPADACEILVGLTSREATQSVLDEHDMGIGDCAIQICDNNKIVIVAPDFSDLTVGFDYFLSHLEFTTVNGAEQVVYTGGDYIVKSSEPRIISDISELSSYKIVYDKSGKYKKYAENIAKSLKKNHEITLEVVCETEPGSEREIIVGKPENESRFVYDYSSLNGMSYVVATSDKSIFIGGVTESAVKTASEYFIERYVRAGNIVTFKMPSNVADTFNAFPAHDDVKLADGADTRIMSFNILSEEWDAAAVMEGRDIRVSSILLNYRPDVVALQEVSNAWYPILENYVGNDYKFTRKKIPSGAGTYTTLAFNQGTTKLIEEGIHLYSVGNSQRLRSVVWGVFESIATKQRYIVFSTHWDVGAERQGNRMIQAKEMAELALSMGKKYNADVFVCGDYNASEGTKEYESFLELSGFVDAKKSAKEVKLACKTYHTLFSEAGTSTFNSIDHITFSPETQPKVLFYNTLVHDYVIDASDHCPIYIDIKLTK